MDQLFSILVVIFTAIDAPQSTSSPRTSLLVSSYDSTILQLQKYDAHTAPYFDSLGAFQKLLDPVLVL